MVFLIIKLNQIIILIYFILSTSLLFASELDSLSTKNSKIDSNNYSFTVGYWNDNFPIDKEFNDLIGRDVFQTDDDFITTSFWLRISKQQNLSKWVFDSYLNVATHRALYFRTDFLSLLLSYETQIKTITLRVGGGIILSGNFGGSQIQNFYHKMSSIEELTLPYSEKTYFGLSVNSLIRSELFKSQKLLVNGIASFSYFTDGGPSSIDLGFENTYTAIENSILFNLRIGYKNYFSLSPNFNPFFGEGIIWGFSSTFRIAKSIQSSFWVTGNQYGKGSQNHFGVSFSFYTEKLVPFIFEDFGYP